MSERRDLAVGDRVRLNNAAAEAHILSGRGRNGTVEGFTIMRGNPRVLWDGNLHAHEISDTYLDFIEPSKETP